MGAVKGTQTMADTKTTTGYGFGTFQGVFTPSILTIIGVVMYLRFGWMLGHVGLSTSLLIVTLGSLITFLTGLSISALATNMRMKGGGAYFMRSAFRWPSCRPSACRSTSPVSPKRLSGPDCPSSRPGSRVWSASPRSSSLRWSRRFRPTSP